MPLGHWCVQIQSLRPPLFRNTVLVLENEKRPVEHTHRHKTRSFGARRPGSSRARSVSSINAGGTGFRRNSRREATSLITHHLGPNSVNIGARFRLHIDISAEVVPISANSVPISADVARHFERIWPELGQIWLGFDRTWAISADVGPKGTFWPDSAQVSAMLTELKSGPDFGQLWANSTELGPRSAKLASRLTEFARGFGRVWGLGADAEHRLPS